MAKYDKVTDLYLNLVIPFCIVYTSVLIGFSFFVDGLSDNYLLNIMYILIITAGFIYGVLAIIRDLKEFGALETLKYWYNKLFKS